MNDTYIQDQDVAPIDQPAELEGIQLNWGPIRICSNAQWSPAPAVPPPATPEFWGVWKRNEEALKTAGIFHFCQSSGDQWVGWWNDIYIDEKKILYTQRSH